MNRFIQTVFAAVAVLAYVDIYEPVVYQWSTVTSSDTTYGLSGRVDYVAVWDDSSRVSGNRSYRIETRQTPYTEAEIDAAVLEYDQAELIETIRGAVFSVWWNVRNERPNVGDNREGMDPVLLDVGEGYDPVPIVAEDHLEEWYLCKESWKRAISSRERSNNP